MKINVNATTQAKTTLCQKGFACVSGSGSAESICKVREIVPGEALLIECASKLLCKYNESFGNWAICTCPTRNELYNSFGI